MKTLLLIVCVCIPLVISKKVATITLLIATLASLGTGVALNFNQAFLWIGAVGLIALLGITPGKRYCA